MAGSRWMKLGSFILFLIVMFSPRAGLAATLQPADPWISLEKSLIQVHKQYAPDAPLLNAPTRSEQVEHYIEAGLWSSAERLLEQAPLPPPTDVARLWLKLFLKQGKYQQIYEHYQRAPSLFEGRPALMLGAIQGALANRDYPAALTLLNQRHLDADLNPEQRYFSALAYWGLREYEKLDTVLLDAVRWAEEESDSPWASRIHLLKVYYHLNQKEYDLAFASMGNLFDNDTDLALLALTWGYFKLGATNNLFSILQALDASPGQSPYHSQIYRILSRFLIEEGNLRGAIEMDQRERDELKKQMNILEEETRLLRRGISISSRSNPPGALLAETLSRLKTQVGKKREMPPLFWYIDLQQRRQMLMRLKNRERMIDQEQRRLQLEMVQRCLALKRREIHLTAKNEDESDRMALRSIQQLYLGARAAFRHGDTIGATTLLKGVLNLAHDQLYGNESAFRLGDMAFNRRDYAEAVSYYQHLLDRTNSPLRALALYKMAWAHYLQGKPAEAVAVLVSQETDLKADETESEAGACHVVRTPQERREPYRLLALALNKLGGPDQLIRHVHHIAPEKGIAFYEKVANHYQRENKADEMFHIIRTWVNTYPRHQKTPLLHQKMVGLIKQSSEVSIDDVVSARTEFVNSYRPGSPWATVNQATEENGVKPLLKNHLRFLMTHYYAESKKTETEAMHKAVLTWYLYYLDMFPDEEDIGKDRFLYAEILTKLKAYEKATLAYRKSAYEDPPHTLSAEAGYQEVLLLEKTYALESPETEAGYDRFASRFPEDVRSNEIAMRLADFAFQRGDYEKSRFYARKASQAFRDQLASRELDLAANRLVVQAFLREKSYDEAIQFINGLMSQNQTGVIQKEFIPLLVLSYFQQAETLKQQGEDDEAAEAFWQAYRYGAGDKMAALALFEAAALWDRPHLRKKSETAFLLFTTLFPKSALHHPALTRLAGLYEGTGRPLKGAETYERAARLPGISNELAENALSQALALYETAEAWEKVIVLAMGKARGIPVTAPPAKREERGRWMLMAAETSAKIGKGVTAMRILDRLVSEAASEEAVSPYVAKAHFLIAESKWDDFEEIELVAPLEENLQKKKALFEKLLENYDYAAVHPSPGIALNANYRIGALFEHFSQSLLESERPESLSLEEEELYENLLMEQALPYIEKAEEAYLQNIQVGEETGVENEWISKSQMHLFMIQQQIDIFNRGAQEVLG